MKETYFLPGHTGDVALQLMEPVRSMRARHPWNVTETKSALLVLDMQDFFLNPSSHAFVPSAEAIIPHIQQLQERFIQANLPVIHTFHTNDESNAGSMKRWWKDLLEPLSPNAALTKQLASPEAAVVEKHQYDAFFNTDLDDILRRQHIGQVVITGVMAHLCCETTARAAFIRGYNVLFVVDGVATYTMDFHRATVLNLSHGFAVPVLSEEIIAAFDATNRLGMG